MKIAIISFGGVFRAPYAAEVMNSIARRKGVGRLLRCLSFGLLKPFSNKHVDPSAIHLLSPNQTQYRGENLQLFDPATINDYDYILAADEKSWAMLTEIAPANTSTKIELLGLYEPYDKILDMPDIFYEFRRGDRGRMLRWGIRRIYRAAEIFVDKHYEEIRSRWQPRTTTQSSFDISDGSWNQEQFNFNRTNSNEAAENVNDLVSAE